MIVIGLCGENCSGKGTVASYLENKGFKRYSLSDIIRDEIKKNGETPTRTLMTDVGNRLRNEFGPSVLADRIISKLDGNRNAVIDSIRNPEEANALKSAFSNFFLLHITAPQRLRFERMIARGRDGDAKTFEEFLEMENREMHSDDRNSQNLSSTCSLADYKVENIGSFYDLYDKVDSVLRKISLSFIDGRPSWDQYFMGIARQVSTRSNCIKRKVAAIIVKDRRIISTGYNGTPRRTPNCSEGGCPRCNSFESSGSGLSECLCSHAEENAIVQAAYHGISLNGSTIYTTFSPCILCAKMIINAGIREVVYSEEYSKSKDAFNLLKSVGVVVRKASS